ncbi:dTDP-4-dehydrorhamnose reductase [Paenibacillus tianmuensis]|uniref:dTDP-4-dehydrorhamnose reductase n=1 Tax=Paenibacillus tianmuensis TaxID=624147 RepID=A0A1G4TVZ1_9BACL|nr:dTDP-4-dehydrorhamnose reductase [Paenibacillus tianmuensis]SCW85498.1 dTDP-4-dehydrorhamnose reductase [Paenibacillus tianmuensis]
MKIFVTGASGQLGTDLVSLLKIKGYEVFGTSSKELDITDINAVKSLIAEDKQPNVIIHSAAYTKVDQAEQNSDEAYAVNAYGTRNVAMAARACGAKLIYISTDYVFDGTSQVPYNEFASVSPQSVYGKSKLAGEQFVRELVPQHYILRTSWVFGKHGSNFVSTMLKLAEDRTQLNVVHDQFGSPTYTVDLAEFILQLLDKELFGTYHVSNTGICSWYEFSKEIFYQAGLQHIEVNPVTTLEFPRPAPRPAYSVMDHMAIRINCLKDLRHWKEALSGFLMEIGKR